MTIVEILRDKVLAGQELTRAEAAEAVRAPLEELCAAADAIRERFCGDAFDLCSIVNAKSGKCGEDCKFCAQSAHYDGRAETYPLLEKEQLIDAAARNARAGALRFSIVTSGRGLSDREVESVCESVRSIVERVGISVCVSVGLLPVEAFRALRSAGVSRAHCNLETSARFFPQVCSTHTFQNKLTAIEAARAAGLTVCSGGIMGLGETWDDRIDLALTLKNLGVRSVPINFLNPIAGTPFADNRLLDEDEKRRTVALFRLLLPDAAVRLAGGRRLMSDRGAACFVSGSNAAITGDMLTTAGVEAAVDGALARRLGYEVKAYE